MPTCPNDNVPYTGSISSTMAVPARLNFHPDRPSRCSTASRASTDAIVQPICTTAAGSGTSGIASRAANGG